MIHELRLTDIGEGLEEAEIVSWLVKLGDEVRRDQPIIEVLTDKSNAELPAPVAGRVIELSGAVGDIIHVGGLVAVIESIVDAAVPESPSTPPRTDAAPQSAPPQAVAATVSAMPAATTVSEVTPSGPRPKASPSTRRVAAERGIDLALVTGSGPGGRILLSDLEQPQSVASADVEPPTLAPETPAPVDAPAPAVTPSTSTTAPEIAAPAPTPAATQVDAVSTAEPVDAEASPVSTERLQTAGTVPLRGIRRIVAQNMAKAWAEIPHIHAFEHVDAEPLLEMRARLQETDRQAYSRLTPLSFFVAAVARALSTHPQANASLDMNEQTITHHRHVNVGIAVAAPQGLVVPVLRGAEQLDFETLSLTLTSLIRGARDGSLSREHFQGGTVTITNFGSLGGEQAVPIIRSPESTIFGFGSIADRPFVIDDEVVARKTMHLVVGADHRLLDGDITTAVLHDVAESLNDPLRLVL